MSLQWANARGDRLIRVRLREAYWLWSGALNPSQVGESIVRIRNTVSHSTTLLRVEVRQSGSGTPTLLVIVRSQMAEKGYRPPPYRIHNLSVVPIKVQQVDVAHDVEVRCWSYLLSHSLSM